MKTILVVFLLLCSFISQAQPIYHERIGFETESIADLNIGWWGIYKPSQPLKPYQLDKRTYSVNQMENCRKFMTWMQQSYLPKGCLGDVKWFANTKFRTDNPNDYRNYLPHSYGAYSAMYMFLKKDAAGKFVPQNGITENWNISVNGLYTISAPVRFLNTREQYYFVIPNLEQYAVKENMDEHTKEGLNFLNFDKHPNIAPYTHFYIPIHTVVSFPPQHVVLMAPDNKLPFETVTIGEFLTLAETQLVVAYNEEQVPRIKQHGDDPEKLKAKLVIAQENLARIKIKYQNRWNEVAKLGKPYGQLDYGDFVLATGGLQSDLFDYTKGSVYFPIMKLSKATFERCKTDQPQWIVISWFGGPTSSSYSIHKMNSILNNFNFKYLYDYFFGKDKVIEPYKPLRSSTYKEEIVLTKASDATNAAANDKSIFFFDDFSTTAVGKAAIGWHSTYAPNTGKKAMVTELDGAEGKWLDLNNNEAHPLNLTTALPQNFELSMDVAVLQNFEWGGNMLELLLSIKDELDYSSKDYISIKIRPGTDGNGGDLTGFASLGTDKSSTLGNYYEVPGFSNNKKINRITLTIKKQGESLKMFADKRMIAENKISIPAHKQFSMMSVRYFHDNETKKYYITNIKITKL